MNKKIVEKIKTSESIISMVLGIVVVVVVGVLLFNYFKGVAKKFVSQPKKTETEFEEVSPTPAAAEETKPEYTGELPTKYMVAKNDSLWKISLKFYGNGFNWVDISRENKIRDPNFLLVGQELIIPNVPSKKIVVIQPITGNSYQVVKGDNLWEIGVRAYQDGFKWPEIAKANHLTNPNLIHPGNTLTIPR